ncbi:hypothetical protein D3C78_1510810 [compost metagenome]
MLPGRSALDGHNSLLRITWHRGHQRGSSGGGYVLPGHSALGGHNSLLHVIMHRGRQSARGGDMGPVRRAACRVPEEAACCRTIQP